MEQNIFNSSFNLAVFQIISTAIFILVFIGVVVWIFKMDKNIIKKMAEIPLDKDNNETINEGEII